MGRLKRIVTLTLISLISVPQMRVQALENKYEQVNETIQIDDNLNLSKNMKFNSVKADVQESIEANKNFRKLVLKTKSNYEVALAYSDGSYSYVDKAETMDEAMGKLNKVQNNIKASDNIIPVILDQSGQVIYADKAVGRVRKYTNGAIVSGISYIYPDSSLSNRYTYVNHNYISEVPLIQTTNNAAQVLISGYRGWMKSVNKDSIANNTNADIVIWPLNQVTNPSYYIVEGGVLFHYISTSLDGNTGSKLYVGTAPDFMKGKENENKKYVSYDGVYFYNGLTVQDGIWNLTLDLREGTRTRCLNSDNPYYSYFNNLPFRTKTNYTADEINKYINNNTEEISKLRGLGKILKDCESDYGVNAILTLGIAINESDFGISKLAQKNNNLFGIGAVDDNPDKAKKYESVEECVIAFTKVLISNGYTNPKESVNNGGFLGNKNLGANVEYASDPFWGEKASRYAFLIDYYLSGENINNMKDENYYQLIRYTGPNRVIGPDGVWFYDIDYNNTVETSAVGTIAPMVSGTRVNIDGTNYIEINAERNHSMGLSDFTGEYKWDYKGYIEEKNIQFINERRTMFEVEDLDEDGKITILDLAKIGKMYNVKSTDKDWNQRYDLNSDNIVDIYDIMRVARKIG